MSLITLFSSPKPFVDKHISTIQRNAIQSWLQLGDSVQVVLIGEETGLAQVASEFGIKHLTNVKRNAQSTPLVSSIFSLARQVGQSPLLAYVNADIILFPDFIHSARTVMAQCQQFLIIGQRWDLEITDLVDFSADYQHRLAQNLHTKGQLHPPAGSDYFIFPRTVFTKIPDFAIGRAGWDNWMIYHARQQGWPVIDATSSITIIHQNHDYSHLPDGKPHYDLPESDDNMALAGGINCMYTVLDSDRQLRNSAVRRPAFNLLRLARRMETWLMPPDQIRQGYRWALARKLRRWRRRKTGSLV
jgi:hypothetical protein